MKYLTEWCKLELVFVAQRYTLYQLLLLFYFVTVQILQQNLTITRRNLEVVCMLS
jgi:hypothetical protein